MRHHQLFLFAATLLCGNGDVSTYGSPPITSHEEYYGHEPNRRSDDGTVADLGAVVQQQAAVIQQQSAAIQALQAKMAGLENAGAVRDRQLTALQKKVAFTAQFNDGGPVDVGQSAPIAFNHVAFNEGNGYDANTGVFTAPAAGVYLFLLHVKSDLNDGNGGDAHLEIVQSGARLAVMSVGQAAGEYRHSSISAVTRAAAGEKVFVRHVSGSTIVDKWQETSFTGALLSAD